LGLPQAEEAIQSSNASKFKYQIGSGLSRCVTKALLGLVKDG